MKRLRPQGPGPRPDPAPFRPKPGARSPKPRRRAAFTLLEVMVAMAILAMALTGILSANARNVVLTERAKMTSIAVQLLRMRFVELEDEVAESGFPDFDEERAGTFEEAGQPNMRWSLKLTKVELPVSQQSLQESAKGKSGGGAGAGAGSLGGLDLQSGPLAGAGAMITQSFEMFRGGLEASIRHARIEVAWNESPTRVQKVDAQMYLTSPGKLDALLPTFAGGQGGAAGAPGGGAAGSRGGASSPAVPSRGGK